MASEHADITARLAAQLAAWRATLPKEPDAKCISQEGRGKQRARGAAKKSAEPTQPTQINP